MFHELEIFEFPEWRFWTFLIQNGLRGDFKIGEFP